MRRRRLVYDALEPGNNDLPDGRRVHWQRTEFDCFVCTLATALQIEYDAVPPPPTDPFSPADRKECGDRLVQWLADDHGLALELHRRAPTEYLLWIGLDQDPTDIAGNHSVLCSCDRLIFDPALAFPVPPGHRVMTTSRLNAAYTLERLEQP